MTATTCTLPYDVQKDMTPTNFTTYDSCPKRYLRREWKKYSPHIPKHCSLPVLRLEPSDRPLFVCEKCSSSNIYLPLCLWCQWTSESAVRNFENNAPRSRTLSAPKFSSYLVERKRTDRKRRVGVVVGGVASPRASIESEDSTEPPVTPRTSFVLVGPEDIAGQGPCTQEEVEEMLLDQTIPIPRIVDPNHDRDQSQTIRNRRHLPPLQLSTAAANQLSTVTSNRPGQDSWSDCRNNKTEDQSPVTDDDGSRRPLRHKRRMSTLIWDSSSDFHERNRESFLSEPVQSTRPRVSTGRHPGHRSMSPTLTSSYRPPRPLYHYIRNHNPQSPSQKSPFDSGIVLDTRAEASVSKELTANDRRSAVPHKSPATRDLDFAMPSPHALTYSTRGFSVSGETEQRMNLARQSDGGGDYKFYEVKGRRRDRISSRMRGITSSLKDMLKIAGSHSFRSPVTAFGVNRSSYLRYAGRENSRSLSRRRGSRRYRPARLKITEDHAHLNKECTDGVIELSTEVVNTPHTSDTFCIPNLTFQHPSISNSVILSTRRHSRYNLAEQSLISRSKQTWLEPSPETLKIRALEEVAANLNAYARNAQARVIQLRQRLADRSIEPEHYQSLQKERWREERRRVVMEEEAKVAQEELSSLSRGHCSKHQDPDRRKANLVSFFRRSPTRASLHFKSLPPLQTKTMTVFTPLSIQPPPPLRRVPPPPVIIKAFPKAREPLNVRTNQLQQSIQMATVKKPPHPRLQSISSSSTATRSTSTSSLATLNDDIMTPVEGFASIYSPTFLATRSKAEIIAELGDVVLPDYATDLLDNLDVVYDEIPLLSGPLLNLRNKISFMDSVTSSSSDPSTPTSKSPRLRMSFTPSKTSSVPLLLPISESSPTSSIRQNKRHLTAVSIGSFFNRGQENEETGDNSSSLPRHSLHVPLPSSEETQRPRNLLKRKSTMILTQPVVTQQSTPKAETGEVRRTPTLVSRITRRPFSMLGRN